MIIIIYTGIQLLKKASKLNLQALITPYPSIKFCYYSFLLKNIVLLHTRNYRILGKYIVKIKTKGREYQ